MSSSERTPLLWTRSQSQSQSQIQTTTTNSSNPISKDKHTQFCTLTGCPPSHSSVDYKHRIPKASLYGRAIAARNSQQATYIFTATLVNTLLLSQVVLGAALTALGATEQPYIIVTLFGASNTVIAGLVAYLKSRGQPMRSRMYRDDLDRVVDEIENSEVMWLGISNGVYGYDELMGPDSDVTVRSEVARLTRLYDRAVRNNSMNNPDMYAAGNSMDGGGVGVGGGYGSGARKGGTSGGGGGQGSVAGGTGGTVPGVVSGPVEDAAPAAKPGPKNDVPPGAASAPAHQNPIAVAPVATDPDQSPATAPPKKDVKKDGEGDKAKSTDQGTSGGNEDTKNTSGASVSEPKPTTSSSGDKKEAASATPALVVNGGVEEDVDASPATRPRIASRHGSKAEGVPKKGEGEDK